MIKKPFFLGKTALPNNVFYAPLAGCSDLPFRQMSAKYRPGLMYCEMVKIEGLLRKNEETLKMLDYDESMHPIGAQLCGSNLDLVADAAKVIEDMGFDVLDFNCGCPVDKVTKDGSGSGMLKNPEKIGEMLKKMVNAVSIPVTVKIRTGWDDNSIVAPLVTKIAEEAGAKAITIHGRTREQGYEGSANWGIIAECKEVAKEILVIGNGDVFDAHAAKAIFEQTKCDAVLVSRGTMGQPWIVKEILDIFEGIEPKEVSIAERREALFEHYQKIRAYQHDRRVITDMRRIGCWYFKKAKGNKDFRCKMVRVESFEEVEDLILNFPFD